MISFSADPKVVTFQPILNKTLSSTDALTILQKYDTLLKPLVERHLGCLGTLFSILVINHYKEVCISKYKLDRTRVNTREWIVENFSKYRHEMISAIETIFKKIIYKKGERHDPKYNPALRELSSALATPDSDSEEEGKIMHFVSSTGLQNRGIKSLEDPRVKTTPPTSTTLTQAPQTPALFLGRASESPGQPIAPPGFYWGSVLMRMPPPQNFTSAPLSPGHTQQLMPYPQWDRSPTQALPMMLAPSRERRVYEAPLMASLQTWSSGDLTYHHPHVYAHPPTFTPPGERGPQAQVPPQFLQVQSPLGTAIYSLVQTSPAAAHPSAIHSHFSHPSSDVIRAPDFPPVERRSVIAPETTHPVRLATDHTLDRQPLRREARPPHELQGGGIHPTSDGASHAAIIHSRGS